MTLADTRVNATALSAALTAISASPNMHRCVCNPIQRQTIIMSASDLEVSKDGLKLSYLRFLSDGAAGYFLLLVLLLAYRAGTFDTLLGHASGFNLEKEEKVVALVLLVLLTIPVGLSLTAMSWFILGPVQRRWQCFFYRHSNWFWFETIRREYKVSAVEKYFDVSRADPDTWYDRAQSLKHVMYVYHPEQLHELQHVRGIRTFLRNFSLLAFTFAIASFFVETLTAAGIWAGIGFVISAFAGLTGFNYNCQIYERVLLLAWKKETPPEDIFPDPGEWRLVSLMADLAPTEPQKLVKWTSKEG